MLGVLRCPEGDAIQIKITSTAIIHTAEWLYFSGMVSLGDIRRLVMRGDRTFPLQIAGVDYVAIIENPPVNSTSPPTGPVVVSGRYRLLPQSAT